MKIRFTSYPGLGGVDLIDPSFDKYESLGIDKIPQNKIKIRGKKITGEIALTSPINLKGKRLGIDLQLKDISDNYRHAKVADFGISINDIDIFKASNFRRTVYLEDFLKYSKLDKFFRDAEVDEVYGTNQPDILKSYGYRTRIFGGNGSDVLYGKHWLTQFFGGTGADLILIEGKKSQSVIHDYNPLEDKILIELSIKDAIRSSLTHSRQKKHFIFSVPGNADAFKIKYSGKLRFSEQDLYESIHFSDKDNIDSVIRSLKVSFPEGDGFRSASVLKKSNDISTMSGAYASEKSNFIHDFLQKSFIKPEINGMSGDDLFAFSNNSSSTLTGGDGKDIFVYDNSSRYSSSHVLNEFNPDEDKIILIQKGFKNLRLRSKRGVFVLDKGRGKDAILKISLKGKTSADHILNSFYFTRNNPMKSWENREILGEGVTVQDGLELLDGSESFWDLGIPLI